MTKAWPVSMYAEQRADDRHDDAGKHQEHAGEFVELRQQHDEDQEHRRAKGIHQERGGLRAVLVRAGEFPVDAGPAGTMLADDLATSACTYRTW
jgi:hypothetical protein